MLGVSYLTLWRATNRKDVPSIRLAGRVLIPRHYLDNLLGKPASPEAEIVAEMAKLAEEQHALYIAQNIPAERMEAIRKRQRELWNQYVNTIGYPGTLE